MSGDRSLTRLSARHWLGRDPGDRAIAVGYDESDGLWQVRLEDDVEEHLDSDLRAAIAEATDSDADDPWIVELADQIEHELNHSEGGT
jgi:hypothetical protein